MTADNFQMPGLSISTDQDNQPGDIDQPRSGNTSYENQSAVVIQAIDTNANIRLETNGTGKVVISYAMSFEQHGGAVTQVGNTSILYGSTPGAGTTGLSFRNTRPSRELDGTGGDLVYTTGELISKNRALLFSMLF
jgi:hypothetical protein